MLDRRFRRWTSVQTRLTSVMVAVAVVAVLALVVSQSHESHVAGTYVTADAKEHGEMLNRVLELEGSSLATLAKDYSNWTEMVEFVQTGDRTWASVNIDEGLGTFRANAAWVFDAAGSQVYAVRDSTLEAGPGPLPPGMSVKDAFGNNRLCHFFVAGPDGPIEMRGATIHPSDDPDRKTPVRGYFLVARTWNRQYLAKLARVTGSTVRIEPVGAGAKPTVTVNQQTGEITFTRPLPAIHGGPEQVLAVSIRHIWIAASRHANRNLFVQLTALALLAVLGSWLALGLWVARPLGLLGRSLESGSAEALKPLESSRTEFGQLAGLVRQFFGQNAALVKEVNERKQAEERARRAAQNWQATFDGINDAVSILSPEGIIRQCNAAMARLARSSAEALVGRSCHEAVHGSFEPPANCPLVRARVSRGRERFDAVIGDRFVEVTVDPLLDETGKMTGAVHIIADVTERRRAEAEVALRAALLDAATDQVIVHDLDGNIVYVNEAACRMHGYEREQLLRMNLRALLAPGEHDAALPHLRTLAAGSDVAFETAHRRRDGSVFPIEVRARVVESAGGRLVISIVRDTTERKRAEAEIAQKNAQLVELNNVKNQLLGMAAHDLRNPLSVVSTASAFLLDNQGRLLPEEKRTDFIRRINSSSEFMLKLVDDLLDVAKIEAGRLDLKFETGDLCGLVDENLTLNRMVAERKGILLDFVAECGVPPLRFDRGKVEQVLNNLVSNALKFSQPGTRVRVAAEQRGDSVVVSVRDQGPGIPAGELDKLFKPFSKTSVRSTAGERSTGLGLAICRKIIEGHGGRIWAESEVGKGSVFSFSLPIATDDKP